MHELLSIPTLHHRRNGIPIDPLNTSASIEDPPAASSQSCHDYNSEELEIKKGRDDPIARKAYIQGKIACMKAELRRKKLEAKMIDGVVQRLCGEVDDSSVLSIAEPQRALREPVVDKHAIVSGAEEQTSRAAAFSSSLSVDQHTRAAAGTSLSPSSGTDPELRITPRVGLTERAVSDWTSSDWADPLVECDGCDDRRAPGKRFVLASLGGAQRLLVERDGGTGAMPMLPSSPFPAAFGNSAADSDCRSPIEACDVSAETTESEPQGAAPATERKGPEQQRRVRFVSPKSTSGALVSSRARAVCSTDAPDLTEQARPRVSLAAGDAGGSQGGRSRCWTPAAGTAVAAVTRTRLGYESDQPRLARSAAAAAGQGQTVPVRSGQISCARGCQEQRRVGGQDSEQTRAGGNLGGGGRARVRVRLDDAVRLEIATGQCPWL